MVTIVSWITFTYLLWTNIAKLPLFAMIFVANILDIVMIDHLPSSILLPTSIMSPADLLPCIITVVTEIEVTIPSCTDTIHGWWDCHDLPEVECGYIRKYAYNFGLHLAIIHEPNTVPLLVILFTSWTFVYASDRLSDLHSLKEETALLI